MLNAGPDHDPAAEGHLGAVVIAAGWQGGVLSRASSCEAGPRRIRPGGPSKEWQRWTAQAVFRTL
jgi:hypothetical protein